MAEESTITNLPGMSFSNWLASYSVGTLETEYKIRNWLFVYNIEVEYINSVSLNIQFYVSSETFETSNIHIRDNKTPETVL